MTRVLFTLICVSAFAGAALVPTPASAGEIVRETAASAFKWRTTECPKPIQNKSPTLSAQESLERYSQDITGYLACLQREAQRDFDKSQMLMQDAIQSELEAETKRTDEMIKRAYRTTR